MIYDEEKEQLKKLGISDEMIASLEKCSVHRSNSGLEFHQRETGIHYLFDEIPCKRPSDAPRYLSIALTTECNLRCPFCYVDKSRKHMLNPKFVKGIVKKAAEEGTLAVSFGGGEPSLYSALEEVLEYTHGETPLAVGMTSNCTENLVKLTPSISRYVDFLRISMDGIRDTYYSHRGIPFEDFVKRFEYLLGFYNVGINYLVDETTIDDLDEAFILLKGWEIRELLLLPCEPDCPESVISRLHDWIRNNKDKGILIEISSTRKGNLPFLAPYGEDDDSLDYAHIDAKGLLKQSSFTNEGIALLIAYNYDYRFSAFRSLFENGSELPGIIEIEGKFTSGGHIEKFYHDFAERKALSIQYEKDIIESGYSNINPSSFDPFGFVPEYFLAYNRKYDLKRIDDLSVRITTKSKMYPAFIYDLTGHNALVTIRYIDKEDKL